jgi:hypothetical protein
MKSHSRVSGQAELGGLLTFAARHRGDKVAPKSAIPATAIELAG